ncbi:hypothetical protein B7494_g3659 [Chlorociboria aeruginascens]|nr:hypothetical protein B7494_g3659 [Chlorociboria aeruginascens]
MEDTSPNGKDRQKNRFMGKLLNAVKEKKSKSPATEEEVSSFLYGPPDKLHMVTDTLPSTPKSSAPHTPKLSKIDTATARRWPTAAEVNNFQRARSRSASRKRKKKGLVVHFTDGQPDIIGEGGEESEIPVIEISTRKKAAIPQPMSRRSIELKEFGVTNGPQPDYVEPPANPEAFRPGPLRRTQTGFVPPAPETQADYTKENSRSCQEGGNISLSHDTSSRDPTSFAARVLADMRSREGEALKHAVLNDYEGKEDSTSPIDPQLEQLRLNTARNSFHIGAPGLENTLQLTRDLPTLPAMAEIPSATSKSASDDSSPTADSPPPVSRSLTFNLHEAAVAVGDDALHDFSSRVVHLFTLFRLSAESSRPLSACSLEECVRVASWWFLRGRLNLETTIRGKPVTPEAQKHAFFVRQQASVDLAKTYWIIEDNINKHPEFLNSTQSANESDQSLADILDLRQAIISGLRKLTMSMKRNNLLPPSSEDAPLPQGLDPSIWIKEDGNRSLPTACQRSIPRMTLFDTFPLSDTEKNFHYGRMFAEASLFEEGESQPYTCPTLVSITRPQKENSLKLIVANQTGTLKICVQADKARGPIWEDVMWSPKKDYLEIKMQRGFKLRLQFSQQDFRTLWGVYDHHTRTQASIHHHADEEAVFETILKTFQVFDQDPQSHTFPKDPLSHCQFRLFEKVKTEKAAAGVQRKHRGFRFGLVSNPKIKQSRGVSQNLPSNVSIEFGFLRGEGGLPALMLKIIDAKAKATVVFTFEDDKQRAELHKLLTGKSLAQREGIIAQIKIQNFGILSHLPEKGHLACIKHLGCQGLRVINEDEGDVQTSRTVMSSQLRVVMDCRYGIITDRVNIGPGELKFRVNVKASNELKVIRQNQLDMTILVSEAEVAPELPRELTQVLETLAASASTRTYTFPTQKDLHLFQAALTGFVVLYDELVTSFNISRRRMVVPIYKKWDAALTRIQVVQREKVVQLIAFFENFSHGECMNFVLKRTDVLETFSNRNGTYSLRIVDAKFPLPKSPAEGVPGNDSGFVCCDMPEYPGEHDDITIVFETEATAEVQQSLLQRIWSWAVLKIHRFRPTLAFWFWRIDIAFSSNLEPPLTSATARCGSE